MRTFPLLFLTACAPTIPGQFVHEVLEFQAGTNAGFGESSFPDVVLGAPDGGGELSGSLDVLSLGCGGIINLGFDPPIADLEGPDLTVFENPFTGFTEYGVVSASADGETWQTWGCNTDTGVGCAGVNPVLADHRNGIDPTDPAVSGGDSFDLADVGLDGVTQVRIVDTGLNDCGGSTGGFDLDAVAVVGSSGL